MTISITIPSTPEHKPLAEAIGHALLDYANGNSTADDPVARVVQNVEKKIEASADTESAIETNGSGKDKASAAGASSTADAEGKSASTDKSPETAADGHSTSSTTVNDAAALDEKGVPFNAEFCGKAAKPFYGSGARKGQWKKKVGVEFDEYDEWYATALLGDKIETTEGEESEGFNAADAFGAAKQEENAPEFKDGGSFMVWISEQQAAGNLDQAMVDEAYATTGHTMPQLFDPATEVEVANALHAAILEQM